MRIGDVVIIEKPLPSQITLVGKIGIVVGGPTNFNQWWVAFVDGDRMGSPIASKSLYVLDHIVSRSLLRRAEGHNRYLVREVASHLRGLRKSLRDIGADLLSLEGEGSRGCWGK